MQKYFHRYAITRIQQYLILLNIAQRKGEECELETIESFLKGFVYGSKAFDLVWHIEKTEEGNFYVDVWKEKSVEDIINDGTIGSPEYFGKIDMDGVYDKNGNPIEINTFAIPEIFKIIEKYKF